MLHSKPLLKNNLKSARLAIAAAVISILATGCSGLSSATDSSRGTSSSSSTGSSGGASPGTSATPPPKATPFPTPAPTPTPTPAPRGANGLSSNQVGVLVNDTDPDSVEIGEYYRVKRNIPIANIIHVTVPIKTKLTATEFAILKSKIDASMPAGVQAIAIAWTVPFAVSCNSLASAITRGFDPVPCQTAPACGFGIANPYFNSNSTRPFTDYGMRPSMHLGGYSVAEAKQLIDRGLSSDGTHPKGKALLMITTDSRRNIRAARYQGPLGYGLSSDVDVQILKQNSVANTTDTLFYVQGLAHVPDVETNSFPPGAVADHLTSSGGFLIGSLQMSCLDWLKGPNGATGTFGTVSEPCAYTEKFPNPQILIAHYTAGDTLVEAYWKSVLQTFQGTFVGDPLAKPW